WKRTSLPQNIRLETVLSAPQSWLVFADDHGICAGLVQRLRILGQSVTEVRRGAEFQDHGNGSFTLAPRNPRGYELLFEALRQADRLPLKIIHGWSVDDGTSSGNGAAPESLVAFDSLTYLAQGLGASAPGDPVHLAVLTANVHRVLDEELSDPAKAAVLGIVHVLPKENPRLVCHGIDVELSEAANIRLQDAVLSELIIQKPETIVAYRRGHRWLQVVDRISAASSPPARQIQSGGVYLLTHAFQELGLALVERLATRHQARVVLLDRKFFPQPEDWQSWIADQGEDDPISRKISRLQPLRRQLHIVSAEFANRERMMQIRSEIERELGPIAGVFHLERTAKTGLIQGKSTSPSSPLRADAAELALLEELFAGADFLALFSSNLAESGGIGQVEQAAHNAVFNCMSERLMARGAPAITIELGTRGWQETDDDNPDRASFIYQQLEEKRQRFGMTIEECLNTIERVLGLELPSVIVSTRDFTALMEQQHLFTADFFQQALEKSASRNGSSSGAHARPEISTPYEAPRSEVEKLLVQIWKSAFRFEEIGINDNFFELGGHSLLAIQVLKNMNETFSARLALKDLFDAPVIAQLAARISGAPADAKDMQALEALLAEIEGMSEEKLRTELESNPFQPGTRAANE
ncbi:MAG TPA: KR domain-containing protein, partial [Candidatus Solibacter sp.]|nr:KR domain-containing protein [Candidatus Solibacter sp.]